MNILTISNTGEGVASVTLSSGLRQLWTLGRMRKPTRCVVCSQAIAQGEFAYRPITNNDNRMERAHKACMETAPEAGA